ncbi:unnamed protein product [Lymnaea stagnalis]|uniref:Ig-like domain-containing protein n=1 Tax=Lymnaea stagnalis TaxID=6523 RepID=A0AAV2HAI0_LYMST
MAQYKTFLAVVLLGISLIACQKSCLIKDRSQFNFSCDVHAMNATNITWSLFSPEENQTHVINICETTFCHPITPSLDDVLFWASASSDAAGRWIQTSTLYGEVSYTNLTRLSTFRQLQCQYSDAVVTVCDSFEAYADISQLTWDKFYVSTGDLIEISVKTDFHFPQAECTLYIDNETVQSNSSVLLDYMNENYFENVINRASEWGYSAVKYYWTFCVFVLLKATLGHDSHDFQISAAVSTSDPAQAVVSTDVISVNLNWSTGHVPVCNYPQIITDEVDVICRSTLLSELVICDFEIFTNGTSRRVEKVKPLAIKYADFLGEPTIVNECLLKVNLTYLGPGYHEFQVTMVRNDTKGIVHNYQSNLTTPLQLTTDYVPGCIYQEVSDNDVVISCRHNISNKDVGCQYQIKTNDTIVQRNASIQIDNDSLGFTECSLSVDPKTLGIGYHQFRITLGKIDSNGNGTLLSNDFTSPLFLYLPTTAIDSYCESNLVDYIKKYVGEHSCTCSMKSPGYPPGSFQWSRVLNNGTLFLGQLGASVLTYSYQNAVETKSFNCRPVSSLMDNLPGTTITPVLYRDPQIERFTANGNQSSLVVNVGDLVTLTCITSGAPLPKVEFVLVQNGRTSTGSPYYTMQITSCSDAGRYTCIVKDNIHFTELEAKLYIMVKCPQQIRDGAHSTTSFAIHVGGNVNITIPVNGYPAPTHYTLLRQSGDQSETLRSGYTAKYYSGEGPDGTVVLSLTDVQENYFTKYTLVFGNDYGNDQKYIFILKKEIGNIKKGTH